MSFVVQSCFSETPLASVSFWVATICHMATEKSGGMASWWTFKLEKRRIVLRMLILLFLLALLATLRQVKSASVAAWQSEAYHPAAWITDGMCKSPTTSLKFQPFSSPRQLSCRTIGEKEVGTDWRSIASQESLLPCHELSVHKQRPRDIRRVGQGRTLQQASHLRNSIVFGSKGGCST